MSSSKQTTGGRFYLDPYERQPTCCYAGDNNRLLQLDEEALKVLRSKLTGWEGCLLNCALEQAEYAKNVRGNCYSHVFMLEAL